MDYKVLMTEDAEADLDQFVRFLLFIKKSEQAAVNLLDDFELTQRSLAQVAGSLHDCSNPRLMKYGYKRINFMSHRYFMLYRIEGEKVIIDNIFHELQDYEKLMD